jgi:putative phosphoribosyl transferase
VVVAAPVGSAEACAELSRDADLVVCLLTPRPFCSVGAWYEDFNQVEDDEVRAVLESQPCTERNSSGRSSR